MAITRNETQITWNANNFILLSSATQQASDAFTFDPTDGAATLQVTANNTGTPTSGDNVNVRISWSTGDILGDTGDDYDTGEHAQLVMILDTYPTDTPGENPARKSIEVPTSAKGLKLMIDAPQGASRNINVRSRIITQRFA